MYLIEKIISLIKGKKYFSLFKYSPDVSEDIIENPQNCNHLFMPLDSSNENFACKYCGLVLPREKLKDINIFKGDAGFKLKKTED